MEGFRKMKDFTKHKSELDKRLTQLFDDEDEINENILSALDHLLESDFDSDSLKIKIEALMKDRRDVTTEILNVIDHLEFLKKCDKEGYVNKSDQWDKDEKE
tara:strand:- start:191 stop:496 length:306 start_codon:yes stop_codon:yes gene_type:complete